MFDKMFVHHCCRMPHYLRGIGVDHAGAATVPPRHKSAEIRSFLVVFRDNLNGSTID